MARFTLFLIHGIGVHRDAAWADKAVKQLAKAWSQGVDIDADMQEHIEIVPIHYDSVFEDYLDDFSDLTRAVFADSLPIPEQDRVDIAEQISQRGVSERHFLWAYLCDVLLYKMDLVKAQVNVCVAKQLFDRITQGSTSDQFGIVAHSLGTRVINDTLQAMISGEASQANIYDLGYRIKFLMQVSDVTDLFGLPLNMDPYPPKDVYPYKTFDYLRTVTNRFDPIARIIPSRLSHWPENLKSEMYLGRSVYQDIVLEHVHETNVHGLLHYLLHPEITNEVFDLCGYGRRLREPVEQCQRFPLLGPEVDPSLKGELRQLIDDSRATVEKSWQTYVNLILRFGDISCQHGVEETVQ